MECKNKFHFGCFLLAQRQSVSVAEAMYIYGQEILEKLEAAEAEIVKLKDVIEDQSDTIDDVEGKLKERDEEIRHLSRTVDSLEYDMVGADEEIRTLRLEVQRANHDLKSATECLGGTIQLLSDEVDALTDEVDALSERRERDLREQAEHENHAAELSALKANRRRSELTLYALGLMAKDVIDAASEIQRALDEGEV